MSKLSSIPAMRLPQKFYSIFRVPNLTEPQNLALPAVAVAYILTFILIIEGLLPDSNGETKNILIIAGLLGLIYNTVIFFFLLPLAKNSRLFRSMVIGLNIVMVCGLIVLDKVSQTHILMTFIFTILVACSILYGRLPTYIFAGVIYVVTRLVLPFNGDPMTVFLESLSIPLIAVLIAETVFHLQRIANQRVDRLKVLNMVARSISSSLEIDQVVALLNSTIQMALDADTYYVGLMKEPARLHLELLYDDGEFYPPTDLPLENTLAGWVIRNRKSLFLTNLPKDMPRLGIKRFVVGQPRASNTWMGTVMQASGQILGLVAVASYHKNAFSQEDLELLENVAQQASLAIDNANHHAEVEQKSRLDSLTSALNHRAFIQRLEILVKDAGLFATPLSVIMLDIDHFKKYNDQYGHLVGDQVLTSLTAVIKSHIRENDIVGRWGGEEFSICLPAASLEQAVHIASRIQQSISQVTFTGRDNAQIPAPTISQGIAVFPDDAPEAFMLIDIADQRLYVAKNRGRNQIEPQQVSR